MWQGKVFQRFATTGAGGEWQVFHCHIPDAYNITTHRTNTQESSLITHNRPLTATTKNQFWAIKIPYIQSYNAVYVLHVGIAPIEQDVVCNINLDRRSFLLLMALFTRTGIYPNHTCLFIRYVVLVSSSSPRCRQWNVLHHWADVDM